MLVLTRKPGEQLTIDENIIVTVLSVNGNRIRLGIEAPDGVKILRGEIEVDLAPGDHRDECNPVPA